MKLTATLPALVLISSLTGCMGTPSSKPASSQPAAVLGADALVPSPRLIVGRVVAIDTAQRFAVVEVARDAPGAALVAGTELVARTLQLQETARIQVSPFLRGRTLGTKILAGQPSPGDEVVWVTP